MQQITVGDTIQIAYLGYKTYETAVHDLEGVLTVRLEEIHFTPGSLFWLRGSIEYRF